MRKKSKSSTTTDAARLAAVSPGEMLAEEFLKPHGMSNYRLAKEIGVPAQRIGEIVAGRRAITADTDLRLCRFFGLSDGWWLRWCWRLRPSTGHGQSRRGMPAARRPGQLLRCRYLLAGRTPSLC